MGYKVAIISPEKSPYSATFIKAHLDFIRGDIIHLCGIFFPVESSVGTYKLSENKFVKKLLINSRWQFSNLYRKLFLNIQLEKFLINEKVEVVLAEFGPVGAEVYEVCKKLQIPLIVHFHGYDAYAHSIFKKYSKRYEKMFAYASYLVAVSHHMKEKLINEGASAEKVVLNPYGPNHIFFNIQPDFESLTFIAVGRFVDKKAPHLSLQAFKLVYEQLPTTRLVMVGDGELWESCKKMVQAWGIDQAVTFYGAAFHEEVAKLFENSFCFIQHSVVAPNGDAEGTPVALLEACAAGLPVVATKHTGIPDVVIHGETGYLVNEQDVKGMAQYMRLLANDRDMAQQMGRGGRQVVKENYTMEKHISTLNELIEKAINKE